MSLDAAELDTNHFPVKIRSPMPEDISHQNNSNE